RRRQRGAADHPPNPGRPEPSQCRAGWPGSGPELRTLSTRRCGNGTMGRTVHGICTESSVPALPRQPPVDSPPPPDVVVAYEPLTNHGDGVNALFGDGHIDWLDKVEAR